VEKLINLLRQFDTGDIALPIMQREFVWRPRKVELFLDSLYKKWPVGSFYLWRPSKRQPSRERRTVGGQMAAEPLRYLLDGQQRLASLSMAIRDESGDLLLPPPGRRQDQAISWCGFFDVLNQNFFVKGRKKGVQKRIDRGDAGLVAFSDLINMDDQTGLQRTSGIEKAVSRMVDGSYIGDTDPEKNKFRTRLLRVASMLDVDVMCQEVETSRLAPTPSKEVDVAIRIFERLNSGGLSLSAGDVAAAELAQETTSSILRPMRDFARETACVSLGLNFVFLTRALATVRCGTARLSKLPRSWASGSTPIEESWELTRKALQGAVELVLRIGWTNRRWLPSANALLPVAYFASRNGGRIPKKDAGEAIRFLCLAAWTGAFSGASETAIDHYVRVLEKAGEGGSARVLTEAIPRSRLSEVGQEDVKAESRMTGALTQIYLAYLVSHAARSWPSGQPLAELCKIEDGMERLEVHHIFPRKFMEHLDSGCDVNTLANYAILSRDDNAFLGDEDPRLSYGKLTTEQKRFARDQFIPFGNEEALLAEAYEAFVEHRARDIAKALNEFLGL